MGLFTRQQPPASALGRATVALRVGPGDVAPPGCVVVEFDAAGKARRHAGPIRAACTYCFHPGPYAVDLTPFAAAPEMGLRLQFVGGDPNPRVGEQRFDLFLYSEVETELSCAALGQLLQQTVQSALLQGQLDLPPCTGVDEWHAFRGGLNQLLYTRYGITVDDCVPVDRGGEVDFAALLLERGARQAAAPVAPVAAPDVAAQDARALRRLFLELGSVGSGLRLVELPSGRFREQQALLQRLGLVTLQVSTMPALAWSAPDRPLPAAGQLRRMQASLRAAQALDEAWGLLARLRQGDESAVLFDGADRIVANLEQAVAARRLSEAP